MPHPKVSSPDLTVGAPGELRVRGYNVMRGYDNNPNATGKAIDGDG